MRILLRAYTHFPDTTSVVREIQWPWYLPIPVPGDTVEHEGIRYHIDQREFNLDHEPFATLRVVVERKSRRELVALGWTEEDHA